MQWNPIQAWNDSRERRDLKIKIAKLFSDIFYKYGPTATIDLKDIDIHGQGKHDPKDQMYIVGIVRDICAEHREWSLVDFAGGFGVVMTSALAGMPGWMRDANTRNGIILVGGSDDLKKGK